MGEPQKTFFVDNRTQTPNKEEQPADILLFDTKSRSDSHEPTNSLTPLSFSHDSDTDTESTNMSSPLRSRSVPPTIIRPRAQKKGDSIIFTNPRDLASQPKESIQSVVVNLQQSAFKQIPSPDLSGASSDFSDFGEGLSELSSLSSEGNKKNQTVTVPSLPVGPHALNHNNNEGIEKVSDCGSDGGSENGIESWVKL